MASEQLIPESPDKWRVTAGTKQKLLDCKIQLKKQLGLRNMTQDGFAKLIIEHWPKILKVIAGKKV